MENAKVGKRPKLEEEVAAFGKLLATQMGLAATVVQLRREQCVLYIGTVEGLGTLGQLALSKKQFLRKIPPWFSSWKPSLMWRKWWRLSVSWKEAKA